jgi:hypothetical protein
MRGQIEPVWLEQGVFKLTGIEPEDRFTAVLREALRDFTHDDLHQSLYPGHAGSFNHTVYWHVEGPSPFSRTSFLVTFKSHRGPSLACGVRVEKGKAEAEDPEHVMTADWDWHRCLSRLPQLPGLIARAQAQLEGETLYCWIETYDPDEDLSYVIREGRFFERIGYQETPWAEIAARLAAQPSQVWTDFSIVRIFDVTTARHGLDADALLTVCTALHPVYQLWRR